MAQLGTVKRRFDRRVAIRAAKEICDVLMPACERIIVAGSLRRRKEKVGDIEIVYVPKFVERQAGLFEEDIIHVNLVDLEIQALIDRCIIDKRRNVKGSEVWGEKNKLAVHVKTDIPVDLFSTTLEAWYNYLVCRTGGMRNNTIIAEAYQRKGCTWNPYKPGYTTKDGMRIANRSEAEVYENAGLRYLHPWERP